VTAQPLDIAVENTSSVSCCIRVTVPTDKVGSVVEDAIRRVQRVARIKGFRPGHAPRGMVERMFAKEWRDEARDKLVRETLAPALEQSGVQPVTMPEMSDIGELKVGTPFKYSLVVEVMPVLAFGDMSGLEASAVRTIVDDEDISIELEGMRVARATMEPVEDGATSGLHATVSYAITERGATSPHVDVPDLTIELGKEALAPGVDAALEGAKAGETRTIETTLPDSFGERHLAGKDVTIAVELQRVERRVLPNLDDEFARDNNFDSLDAMRADVRQRLDKVAAEMTATRRRQAALKALLVRHPFDVPQSMVDMHTDRTIDSMFHGADQQIKDYLRDKMRGSSVDAVRSAIAIREIGKAREVEIADAEVDAHVEAMLAERPRDAPRLRSQYARAEVRERLKTHLLEQRVLDLLVSVSHISDASERPLRESDRE